MPRYDLVLKSGTVVDGTQFPRYVADIGISNGRIEKIGSLGDYTATREIDAEGRIVAPGVIDPHTHYDAPNPLGPPLHQLELARLHHRRRRQLRLRLLALPAGPPRALHADDGEHRAGALRGDEAGARVGLEHVPRVDGAHEAAAARHQPRQLHPAGLHAHLRDGHRRGQAPAGQRRGAPAAPGHAARSDGLRRHRLLAVPPRRQQRPCRHRRHADADGLHAG